MAAPTQAERDAFLWMQGRMVELLLRHDAPRFDTTFGERAAEMFADPRLRRFRELAVVFFLRTELFESILPRIRRRLSFVAPRELLVEELPPRGRIDWSRTMAASLRDRPGEAPLEVQTRQRRRHFATPENLLTVMTLLEYRAAAQRLLDTETAQEGARSIRHPLNELVDACTRELVFPQFAGLVRDAQAIIDGHAHESPTDLEARVAAQLAPGRNSAYDDLLAWRGKLAALHLLDRSAETPPEAMLGSDPARDNYLYQIWLFYELADFLQHASQLDDWNLGQMVLTFRWGEGATEQRYRLQHDQAIPSRWERAPGVRPDYYIERIGRDEVRDGDTLIWHEPGYVLDAKYYKPRDSARAPASPVKRMIADLALTGERHGALLFAFQNREQDANTEVDLAERAIAAEPSAFTQPLYNVQPERHEPGAASGAQIAIWQLQPHGTDQPGPIGPVLRALLDEVHTTLQRRVPITCQGIFLDALSASERIGLSDRYGASLNESDELLICPKPHIGPWRVDLVSRTRHCCQDARLCHIIGQPHARPPMRPPRNAEELLQELQRIFEQAGDAELDSEAIGAIARQVEGLTRRFAEIAGAYKRIDMYYNRLRDFGLEVFDRLRPAERESLGLAVFLLEQLDAIGASDYSAPAIHFSSVMEIEVQRRVFACPTLTGDIAKPKKQTLGALPFMRQYPGQTAGNWQRLVEFTAQHWNEQIDPDDAERLVSFDQFVAKALDSISQIRNKAAHTHPVSRDEYAKLQRLMLQGGKLASGALNALLLAWQD